MSPYPEEMFLRDPDSVIDFEVRNQLAEIPTFESSYLLDIPMGVDPTEFAFESEQQKARILHSLFTCCCIVMAKLTLKLSEILRVIADRI
jgi:hypothetical protein